MICAIPLTGLDYFFPWADSRVFPALFASGGRHRLSRADLLVRVQQHWQPWEERQRHQTAPCLQFLAVRFAVGAVHVRLTDRSSISSVTLPPASAESIGERL